MSIEQGVSVEQPHVTISSTFGGETLTFGCSVTGIKHLHRSSRSYANATGSSAGSSELRADFQMAVWMCAYFAFFSNASLEGDSDLTFGVFVTFFYPSVSTRLQHGPRTCSMSPSYWLANDSQLCTSWVSPELLSRNHCLATFVHERLEWTLVDQSLGKSETEWSCVDVARYKISSNVYKPPPSWLTPTAIATSPICMLATSTANMSTETTAQNLLTVGNWLREQ